MSYNGIFKSLLLSFALIFLLTVHVVAIEPPAAKKILPRPTHEWRHDHLNQMFNSMQTQSGENPRVFQDVDAENYTMDFIFDLEASTLNAIVTIKGAALNSRLDEIIVDFYDDVPVNSIKFNGQDFTSFERKNNKVYMDISSSPIGANEDFTIIFDYTFTLGSSYNHGIVLRDQSFNPLLSNSEGESIYSVCSAGQPYFSSGWWPSFDYPSDKATYDIHITCPDNLIAVSNGSLQGEPLDNGDGTKTFYWKEKHRMYTSVFAVAISEYELFEDTYVSPLDNTEMPLFFYAFSPDAKKALGDGEGDYPFYTKAALQIFPVLFGEYPFIDEKYGVLESPFSRGSLEHQTITHLTYTATEKSSNWDVVVHELGHQWWGDWVTHAKTGTMYGFMRGLPHIRRFFLMNSIPENHPANFFLIIMMTDFMMGSLRARPMPRTFQTHGMRIM